MARRLVNVDRETPLLLPPSIQEWLPHDDMARMVVDASTLVSESEMRFNWKGCGSEQYPPQMMLALLIFCYSGGVFSSRKIERATYRDVAVRYITGDTHPDHDTIARFRRENGALFKTCFARVLELAREMGVKRVGNVAIDGSKVEANASKKRVRALDRLREDIPNFEKRVDDLTAQAEKADHAEAGKATDDRLPERLSKATRRRDELRRAMETLKQRTLRDATQREQERNDFDSNGPGEPPRKRSNEPAEADNTNLTDPDARLLPGKKGGYQPAYNVQLSVQADCTAPLILATTVCDQSSDRRQLEPMVERTIAACPETCRVLVDCGYDNSAQIHKMESKHGVVIYCPPEERESDKKAARQSAARQRTIDFREGMRACMRSEFGRKAKRIRGTTVEPVIGWIKDTIGFRRFHLRGLVKVGLEWDLVCLGFNLRLLHRLQNGGKTATAG